MLRRRVISLLSTSIRAAQEDCPKPISVSSPFMSQHRDFHQSLRFPWDGLKPSFHFHNARAYISLLALNDLRDNPGARKQKTRKGRGIGSGKGKTAGRGHKGQKARGTMKFGFEGGQTPLRRRVPKRGFKNPFSLTFQPVGLGKIAKLINSGKIDSSVLITRKTLKDAGAIGKQIEDGVRLMARGAEYIQWPIHLEVMFLFSLPLLLIVSLTD
ncbi:uncharacterized protein [Primulina huaijiensis]|uniref:uncharacterized protein n=1 Tax=Primulina huaijiensis TaxID=1492673 RepID=UPI003CC76061